MLRGIGISLFLLYALTRIARAAFSDGYTERVDQVQDFRTGEWRERRVRLQRYTAFEVWTARLFLVVVFSFAAYGLWMYRDMLFRLI